MLKQITAWFCATFLALPVWAESEKLPQTVSQAYHLMMNTVTEYGDRGIAFRPYSAHPDDQYFEWYDGFPSTYDLPVVEDPWHSSFSASAFGIDSLPAMLDCESIGQPTLAYLRDYFADKDQEYLSQTEKFQWRLVNYFAEVPKEAVAMEVCQLFFGLHINATEGWEYESLLATIGDNFSDTKSVDRQQERPNDSHSFDGVGNLHLNGAVVIAFKAMVNEKPSDGEHIPMWMMSVSYRLASFPPS